MVATMIVMDNDQMEIMESFEDGHGWRLHRTSGIKSKQKTNSYLSRHTNSDRDAV